MSVRKRVNGRNDLGEVTPCDCGGVNLTLGPMTLHLAADEVPLLHDLITAALDLSTVRERETRDRIGGRIKAQGNTLH